MTAKSPIFNWIVKNFRRIDLPDDDIEMQYNGRRLRTKDDLHLLKYKADIEVLHPVYV